ncbi:hypothetical protein LTR84_002254 [Exophiala bonariae]|uniref:polynucleotide adenylyltransferase n=1 Tax=Exophiala bonariae TaxID=1690606 RepID=A0AAV9NB13_9EURO|nr:hypothetical protein LTR84_002254 [Exophiala bonariae]
MDSTTPGPPGPPGFNPHVMSQLQDLSQRGRRNQNGRGRGRQQASRPQPAHPQQSADWSNQPEDFPPLGTQVPPKPSRLGGPHGPSVGPLNQFHTSNHNNLLNAHHDPIQSFNSTQPHSPREFQERARGNFRNQRSNFHSYSHQSQTSAPLPLQTTSSVRPPQSGGQLFNPNSDMAYGSNQHAQRARLVVSKKQADYLQRVGLQAYQTHSLKKDERLKKEAFRQELEIVARDALSAAYPGLDLSQIKLKCFGSLSNGFGLADSDMDLLLSLPDYQQADSVHESQSQSEHPQSTSGATSITEEHGFKVEARRILEKAFLDCGFGARLLTNTRVPILRVCSHPGEELLHNLRENRAAWEKTSSSGTATEVGDKAPSTPTMSTPSNSNEASADLDSVHKNLAELNLTDAVQPPRTSRNNPKLEFNGNVGIPCDINFSNFVAIHNSALLRTYHDFDSRVADLGFFVKVWAKARDINTPYRGTLSSYGYILMVLHYLMNVARPPVIPNLQALAKTEDGWFPDRPVELFEGFDIRFLRGSKELEEVRSTMPKNLESTGQLLRGFFHYYATREGFHWMHDVISIRERTGRMTKAQKGWTEAKWSQQSNSQVRLRYLLAIEDPFEIEHNIARTVGHTGIVAIRDEFRRANTILETLGTDVEVPLDEFLEPVANRGDTLRKDQEFHRQKQLQLKEQLEAKEKGQMLKTSDESTEVNVDGMLGNPNWAQPQGTDFHAMNNHQQRGSKLTGKPSQGMEKKQRPPWSHRTVQIESDSEDDDSRDSKTTRTDNSLPDSDTVSLQGTNSRCWVNFMHDEEYVENGFDEDGNIIGWDMDTQDGRWLQWRDNKIRAGAKLSIHKTNLRELHEQCPFDPRRPIQKQPNYRERQKKKQLKRPPWPLRPAEPEVDSSDLSQKSHTKRPQPRDRVSNPRFQFIAKDEMPLPYKNTYLPTTPPTSSEPTKHQAPSSQPTKHQAGLLRLMKSTTESVPVQRSAFLAKPESPVIGMDKLNERFFGASSHYGDNTLQSSQEVDSEERVVVPATLYPGVKREERPREEDPNIMPIPEDLGFQFDARQLQDLDAIANGGNGCARGGAGYSVESEYEWGGGGMMGYKYSNSTREMEKSDTHTPYEGGKGDDQGLLNELPGGLE